MPRTSPSLAGWHVLDPGLSRLTKQLPRLFHTTLIVCLTDRLCRMQDIYSQV